MTPILDARDACEFAAGHAPEAVNIPLNELPSRMHELPEKGTCLQVFHDGAGELARAISLLQARGYIAAAATIVDLSETGPTTHCLWRPSPLLIELAPERAGRAADLACGSGREAVYLARHGWQVDAVDILPDALTKARDLAARSGVTIETHCHDLTQGVPLPEGQYDMVTIFRYLHRPLLPAAARLLRPGGRLIMEVFHVSDAADASRDRSRLVGDGELVQLMSPSCDPIITRDGIERNGRRYSQLIAVRRVP